MQNGLAVDHQFAEGDVELEQSYIEETLSIYKPEFVFLKSAIWSAGELHGQFELRTYPFTRTGHIEYVTASMFMLYLSQLGYVFARGFCEGQLKTTKRMTLSQFFAARDRGDIVFAGFDHFRIKRKIPIANELFTLSLNLERTMTLEKQLLGMVDFSAAGGAFNGKARVVVTYER